MPVYGAACTFATAPRLAQKSAARSANTRRRICLSRLTESRCVFEMPRRCGVVLYICSYIVVSDRFWRCHAFAAWRFTFLARFAGYATNVRLHAASACIPVILATFSSCETLVPTPQGRGMMRPARHCRICTFHLFPVVLSGDVKVEHFPVDYLHENAVHSC